MRTFLAALAVTAVGLGVGGVASARQTTSDNEANSLGKTTLDTTLTAGINYGTGIPDGEWITAETQGVEIGLRATDRTDGLLAVSGANGDRVGVYSASTGLDTGTTDLAEWNYEFHVDLSRATGNAEGTTLNDYSLVLEQDYTEQNLFGALGTDPVNLFMPDVCHFATDTVCQQSWNPAFGNTDFDLTVPDTYNLRLVLTPTTFSGPSVAVAIQVNVT